MLTLIQYVSLPWATTSCSPTNVDGLYVITAHNNYLLDFYTGASYYIDISPQNRYQTVFFDYNGERHTITDGRRIRLLRNSRILSWIESPFNCSRCGCSLHIDHVRNEGQTTTLFASCNMFIMKFSIHWS